MTQQNHSIGPTQDLLRDGPSPLVLHVAMARWQYAGAQAALGTYLKGGDLPIATSTALQDWETNHGKHRGGALNAALARHCEHRLKHFLGGIERYQTDPFKRPPGGRTTTAICETATALACGGEGPPIVLIPSLINPSWVLDLLPGRSFAAFLARHAGRVFLIDWGAPGPAQSRYDLGDYVARQLVPLLDEICRQYGRAHIIGYCLGGNLALAAALEAPHLAQSVTAIAAPWDFSHMGAGARQLAASTHHQLTPVMAKTGFMPSETLQALFAQLDPTQMERKFFDFAQLNAHDPKQREKMDHFIAVEDWSNSGPDLAAGAAKTCLIDFYQDNAAAKGAWVVGGKAVNPSSLRCPSLVVAAKRDKIVPEASTKALAEQMPDNSLLTVDAGHVGMMVGSSAQQRCWTPVAEWLTTHTR